ncbi:MAG: hypothetical protein KDD70_04160 [Bdellovibrionales bacterium]|nr:hypothetical protein [Bdellovibrionales bacterium]
MLNRTNLPPFEQSIRTLSNQSWEIKSDNASAHLILPADLNLPLPDEPFEQGVIERRGGNGNEPVEFIIKRPPHHFWPNSSGDGGRV